MLPLLLAVAALSAEDWMVDQELRFDPARVHYFAVEKVIDKEKQLMLVQGIFVGQAGEGGVPAESRAVSPFVLKGVSTRGVVDNAKLKLPHVYKVADTYEYRGATYFLVEFVKEAPPLPAPAPLPEVRVWTIRGKPLEAAFKEVVGNTVHLETKVAAVSFPLGFFSPADKAWIAERRKQQKP